MIKAKILTQWNKDENGNTPDVFRFLQAGESGMDITGEQKVDSHLVNPVVVELWCEQSTLDNIIAELGEEVILSTEQDEIATEPNNEFLVWESEDGQAQLIEQLEPKPVELKPVFTAKEFVKPSLLSFEAESVDDIVRWIKERPEDEIIDEKPVEIKEKVKPK